MKKLISTILRQYALALLSLAKKIYDPPVDYSFEEKRQAMCSHDDLMTMCSDCGKVMHISYTYHMTNPWVRNRTHTG